SKVHVPQPYSFGYDNVDEFGTRLTRQETGDEFNNKVGSYGYVDAHGIARTVNYVADALAVYTHKVAPLAYSTVARAPLGYALGHTTIV
ncbi:unnamed protein product, partial [Ixodes pacificus]